MFFSTRKKSKKIEKRAISLASAVGYGDPRTAGGKERQGKPFPELLFLF